MELSLQEILDWCQTEKKRFWEYMLYDDMTQRGASREESFAYMEKIFDTMEQTVKTYRQERLSASELVGAEGGKLEAYAKTGNTLCGSFMEEAMITALKMAESNACMRRIVAAPTAGSCGVIPAVLLPYYEMKQVPKEEILKALFVTGGIGEVIAQRASISGAEGGCQAEIGSASAMAAGALVYLQGGSDEQICHAAALALKGLLGLVCDPVAGLVEIPCVKRNVLGCVNAISCADMAMAGIQSRIPPDEVIDAMQEVGCKMDSAFRETALGGLAATKTGQEIMHKLMESEEDGTITT